MHELIVKRVANLLSTKSIVTIIATAVFAYLSITGNLSEQFMMVYTVIISFYFGTQAQKIQDTLDKTN